MVLFLGYTEERRGYLVIINQEKKKKGKKKSVKFKIKEIMRLSKDQFFGNFAPYDLHAVRPLVCAGFVVNTVAMPF